MRWVADPFQELGVHVRVRVQPTALVPTTATQEHLALLRWISSLARDADFRRFAKAAAEEKVLRDLLLEHVKD